MVNPIRAASTSWRDCKRAQIVLLRAEGVSWHDVAVRARLVALDMITRLDTAEDVAILSRRLLELGAFPREAAAGAAHLSVAAANRV